MIAYPLKQLSSVFVAVLTDFNQKILPFVILSQIYPLCTPKERLSKWNPHLIHGQDVWAYLFNGFCIQVYKVIIILLSKDKVKSFLTWVDLPPWKKTIFFKNSPVHFLFFTPDDFPRTPTIRVCVWFWSRIFFCLWKELPMRVLG